MTISIKLLLTLASLQVLAVAAALAAKQKPEMGAVSLISAFRELDGYLAGKVNSSDLAANLAAANELIGCEQRKCLSFSLRKGKKKDLEKVATRFVHLLEVATQPDTKCTQQTVDYIEDVSTAHAFQLYGVADKQTGRFHLETFKRVDDILDPQLESLRAKCEQHFDEAFRQQLASLSAKVRRQVYEVIFTDQVLAGLAQIKYNLAYVGSAVAKQTDFDNYKAALETKNRANFLEYYMKFYKINLRKPCKAFYEHLDELAQSFREFARFFNRYKVPAQSSSEEFQVSLERYVQCYAVGKKFDDDDSVREQADEIFTDYLDDVKYDQVDFQSQEPRSFGGRRKY